MPVDADDRVHPRLAAFLEETPHHPAWVIRKGRAVHAGLKRSYSSSRYDELTDSSRILSPEGARVNILGQGETLTNSGRKRVLEKITLRVALLFAGEKAGRRIGTNLRGILGSFGQMVLHRGLRSRYPAY